MITGLSHTGLVVRDMGKMIDFYHDTFGFQKILETTVSGKETDDIVNFPCGAGDNRSNATG